MEGGVWGAGMGWASQIICLSLVETRVHNSTSSAPRRQTLDQAAIFSATLVLGSISCRAKINDITFMLFRL